MFKMKNLKCAAIILAVFCTVQLNRLFAEPPEPALFEAQTMLVRIPAAELPDAITQNGELNYPTPLNIASIMLGGEDCETVSVLSVSIAPAMNEARSQGSSEYREDKTIAVRNKKTDVTVIDNISVTCKQSLDIALLKIPGQQIKFSNEKTSLKDDNSVLCSYSFEYSNSDIVPYEDLTDGNQNEDKQPASDKIVNESCVCNTAFTIEPDRTIVVSCQKRDDDFLILLFRLTAK
jgi:hypothetical protein